MRAPTRGRAAGPPRSGVAAFRRLGIVGTVALGVLLLVVVAVIVGPWLWTTDPDATDLAAAFAGFSSEHPLGADEYGRDLLSRLLHGGRLSLLGAVIVLTGETVLGLSIGALAAMTSGRVARLLSRLIDALLSLPMLAVAFALAGALGRSFTNVIIALIVTGWPWYARAYRGMFLAEREHAYVDAARMVGRSTGMVAARHILPNIGGPALVMMTVNLGSAILGLAALSFLGLGVQAPQAEWGAMVNYGRPFFETHPWLIVAPGLVITVTVLVVNLLGDSLRDLMDPRYVSSREQRRLPWTGPGRRRPATTRSDEPGRDGVSAPAGSTGS